MTDVGYPTCPGCGNTPDRRHQLFCSVCWVEVPAKARTAVDTAWAALSRRPASREARAGYDEAVSAAAAHVGPSEGR